MTLTVILTALVVLILAVLLVCALILGHCAAIVRRKTGKPTPICRVLGQIFAAEVA